MRFNPNFLAVFAFLLIGLIWSGGNGWWLVAMGALVLVPPFLAQFFDDKGRRR